ncbi:glutathione-dependent formaldehyde-activating protein [Lepidopterella palustris CBS 459.81]|uniref:Glutathione-dependent formaldehyde-activating protein n=1 Tax=Lepidopterella palustris CBS 459.81 TaxID=1314670 RepID=A0A8E2JD22_9PEZI|nr:glutathione-dependent formaldehyde-activating protein [Lepidopterella palustris CBS 459.81]
MANTTSSHAPLEGGCACGTLRYRLETTPLFVHCCHCTYCQREEGTAFAINAMIESSFLTLLTPTSPLIVDTPSESGLGQRIARCPKCFVAIWSYYGGMGPVVSFVRVGTLDDPNRSPPDIHIYTGTKQDWVILPQGVPAVEEYYDQNIYWPKESLARKESIRPQLQAYRRSLEERMRQVEQVIKDASS